MSSSLIPARSGIATFLNASQRIRIINTHGHQVIDTWAFIAPSDRSSRPHRNDKTAVPVEFMSMSHSRAAMNSLRPYVGCNLVSNRRRPVLKFVKDTSPGIHDTVCCHLMPLEIRCSIC